MNAEPSTGLYDPQPRQLVLRDLVRRGRERLDRLPDGALAELLEDALYEERHRLERRQAEEGERERLDVLAQALVRGDRQRQLDAAMSLVLAWGDEIHGIFDPRMYRFATRLLPRALTGLLSQRRRPSMRRWLAGEARDLDLGSRFDVRGNTALLRDLSREATLILAPTHVSNLDSPLIGLALHLVGLPPFVYGAGLNLFSNPVMGFFLRRLGAYTVDRTKRARLYKDVLKDYSIRCLVTHHHSLFFPGGTRARSGHLETTIKKGLLGTGVVAWQEMLAKGSENPDVYIVPATLTFQLVLEANTLIEDHLEREGKHRYIISDDEFAEPRTVANFARRVLDLDDSVVVHFGDPMDCLGNPVSADAAERHQQSIDRRRYVTDHEGKVEWDPQRDRCYTDRLADTLAGAYPRGTAVMATHLSAWVAWTLLEERIGSRDPFRLVRVPALSRHLSRERFADRLRWAMGVVDRGVTEGRWDTLLPPTAEEVLDQALHRFGVYHRSHALVVRGAELVIEDPRLCLYYRNRLDHRGLFANEREPEEEE
ncbi:MAG: 1-acyl-sn-glycerol-3-phosphate acyltransferase [Deltaproteobacteria bacterium]|nr:1-acyl-sn-glycerol-3-phosphate acyltransferase [Deltaproteobacteria bacterium]MBW2254000.1 1-acyl-sn-glycerol-3-phosphate acyltransferase [Deltaproteobacteria bacterium]